MSYPVFDASTLPARVLPIKMTQGSTKRYLGGKALTGTQYFELNFESDDGLVSSKAQALYEFWRTDCNYGTMPFFIALPFFGHDMDDAAPNFLVRFVDDLETEFEASWKLTVRLEVVSGSGGQEFVTDNAEIVTDNGEPVTDGTGIIINNNEVITWQI